MLQQQHKTRICIEILPTATSFDEGLFHIKQGLIDCMHAAGELELPHAISDLTISLGVLGLQDHEVIAPSASTCKMTATYPLRLYRDSLILGPLSLSTQPDAPCPHCLERRWLSNRSKEEQFTLRYSSQFVVVGQSPFLTPFVIDAIWAIIVHALRYEFTPSPMGEYAFSVLNLTTLASTRHSMLQDSACPSCADPTPDTPEAAILQLSSRPKTGSSTYHLVKATDYDLPLSSLLNPITGVLGPGAFSDVHNLLSAPVTGIFHVRNRFACLDAWWSGHGSDYHHSLRLGMLEGIERYAGHTLHGKRITVQGSYEDLQAYALDPRTCGLYDECFYQENALYYVPFTPQLNIPWVWGYSFRRDAPILVPDQLVYYLDYHQDRPTFVQECSNGCATGSCMEEAIFHGLLELIERDAFVMTWYARIAPPRIDPRSCSRPEILFALEGLEKLGYELSLFDLRFDVRIPSILGVVTLKKPGLGNLALAAGAGFDPEDAIQSALREIACYLPDFRERLERCLEATRATAQDFSKVVELKHHALLHGLPEMGIHSQFLFQNPLCRPLEETYRDWETIRPHNQDLRDDLLFCIEEVMQLGLDVIVVDQTSREQARTGLRTACVIVPGLLPIDFGWNRVRISQLPRLHTVPRTTGYRETDFEFCIQDSIPHPFP